MKKTNNKLESLLKGLHSIRKYNNYLNSISDRYEYKNMRKPSYNSKNNWIFNFIQKIKKCFYNKSNTKLLKSILVLIIVIILFKNLVMTFGILILGFICIMAYITKGKFLKVIDKILYFLIKRFKKNYW